MLVSGLSIDARLYDFLEYEALPGTTISSSRSFAAFADILRALAPMNRDLLEKRDAFQSRFDDWHQKNGAPIDLAAGRRLLQGARHL